MILVGAASKGIIQRGFQHNAMVYKTPYAKNPFDTVTDEELEEYKKVVERKQKGESCKYDPVSHIFVRYVVSCIFFFRRQFVWMLLYDSAGTVTCNYVMKYCLDATHKNMANVQNFEAVSIKFNTDRVYLHNKCLSEDVCDDGGGCGGDL